MTTQSVPHNPASRIYRDLLHALSLDLNDRLASEHSEAIVNGLAEELKHSLESEGITRRLVHLAVRAPKSEEERLHVAAQALLAPSVTLSFTQTSREVGEPPARRLFVWAELTIAAPQGEKS